MQPGSLSRYLWILLLAAIRLWLVLLHLKSVFLGFCSNSLHLYLWLLYFAAWDFFMMPGSPSRYLWIFILFSMRLFLILLQLKWVFFVMLVFQWRYVCLSYFPACFRAESCSYCQVVHSDIYGICSLLVEFGLVLLHLK